MSTGACCTPAHRKPAAIRFARYPRKGAWSMSSNREPRGDAANIWREAVVDNRPANGQQHGLITVNGLRLHYVTAGTGPPIVLLHGFPEFWYSWRPQLPALAAAGFRAIALDLPGYNESDKPAAVKRY